MTGALTAFAADPGGCFSGCSRNIPIWRLLVAHARRSGRRTAAVAAVGSRNISEN